MPGEPESALPSVWQRVCLLRVEPPQSHEGGFAGAILRCTCPCILPDGGFVAISKLIANHDYIRAVERDVDVRVIHGEFEGQKFSARLLAPRNQKPGAPALLWTHGGGHLIGSPGFYDPQNSRIADELGAVVLAPSYRKSTAALSRRP